MFFGLGVAEFSHPLPTSAAAAAAGFTLLQKLH